MRESGTVRGHYALTVIGKDKPGIVAATAGVLYRLGFNIEDSSCTMLGGEFAMILIVSHVEHFGKARILEEFKGICQEMGLSVSVRPLSTEESVYHPPVGELCVVTVYGGDRPGIVYHVTEKLALRGINITDLNTKLVGSDSEPVYVMTLEAALPEGESEESLAELLDLLKKQLDVEISIRTVTPVCF
jgi:glycine cleavage system transcriptional repressor